MPDPAIPDPAIPDADALAVAVGAALGGRDTAARTFGITLDEIAAGFARMSMPVRDDMLNGHAVCHGGIIFTLADTAFAYACNSRNRATLAAAAEIAFLSPGRLGEVLVAVARERAAAGRTGIYDVDVTERASGRQVALFRGRSQQIPGEVIATDDGGIA
jgi:acyl-CoA thioesterase